MWVVLSHSLETLDRIQGRKEKARPFSELPLPALHLSWGKGLPSLTFSMVFYWNIWGQENMNQTPWISEQNWMLLPSACSPRYFGHSHGQVTDTGALEHHAQHSRHSLVSTRCQLLSRLMYELGWGLPQEVFKQGWDSCVAVGSLNTPPPPKSVAYTRVKMIIRGIEKNWMRPKVCQHRTGTRMCESSIACLCFQSWHIAKCQRKLKPQVLTDMPASFQRHK